MLNIVADFAVGLVAFLHLFFLILEMFLWTKPYGRRVFDLTEEFSKESAVLASNQGLYNGFLAAGLIWGLMEKGFGFEIKIFFLSCVIIAGVFGAFTAKRSMLFIQALPAAIALALVIFS